MDDLRLSLLLIGIAVVAAIYFWDRYRRRGTRHPDKELDVLDKALLESLDVGRDRADEASVREALGELQGLKGERGHNSAVDMDDLRSLIPAHDEASTEGNRDGESVPDEEADDQPRQPDENLIVIMNVMAQADRVFSGSELHRALDDVDLQYGDMKIFHHYGVGEMSGEEPVFSVANVREPGFLPLETLDELSTSGICLFMRLPGPLDGRVAFELMLNTGQRLADKLDGELRDDTRSLLSLESIGRIRDRIAAFERRQLEPAV